MTRYENILCSYFDFQSPTSVEPTSSDTSLRFSSTLDPDNPTTTFTMKVNCDLMHIYVHYDLITSPILRIGIAVTQGG